MALPSCKAVDVSPPYSVLLTVVNGDCPANGISI